MTLITSISGIRGTIGGIPGESLTPVDIVNFTSAFARFIRKKAQKEKIKIVVGRDSRKSGPMLEQLVTGTLMAMGSDVLLLGLATTPTVEIAVPLEDADGGIILTASHNPGEWNALKLLNGKGEFISASDGQELISIIEKQEFGFSPWNQLGKVNYNEDYADRHIEMIKSLRLVDTGLIRKAGFRVVVDCVNSVGGIIIPDLLKELGVKEVIELYTEPNGEFPHNPEPLPENLTEIATRIIEEGADLGFVVDPDVDRLAIINEDGSMFGEEYTLVAVADYVLSKTPGNTCSNLSSTRALRDISHNYGVEYFASAVGEVNVVETMKANNCVIGGEGNGGVIYPELHYGRDALVGIALFLTHLAGLEIKPSELKKKYPGYVISKNKIQLDKGMNLDGMLSNIKESFRKYPVNDEDGVKIDFEKGWVHLRKSNTEPIIRVYAEHETVQEAENLARKVMDEIKRGQSTD